MSEQNPQNDPEHVRNCDEIRDAILENFREHMKTWNSLDADERKHTGATHPGMMHSLIMGAVVTLRNFVGRDATRIGRLEKRIAELEARPQMKYQGVFEDGRAYNPGDFCTFHGSIWYCRSATAGGRPGSSASWQLAVKRGADGKDAR